MQHEAHQFVHVGWVEHAKPPVWRRRPLKHVPFEWYTCIYRMACIKCPFLIVQDQASLIRSQDTVETFLKSVQLTPEELAAAEDDRDKIQETVARTDGLSPPRTLYQRAKGTGTRGIPLKVLHRDDV